jgi:hypothetical protein
MVGRLFELVSQNAGCHLQDADEMRPIVRRRDLDPAGKLAAADAYEVAQGRDGCGPLGALGTWLRGRRLLLGKTADGRCLRLGCAFLCSLKERGPIVV